MCIGSGSSVEAPNELIISWEIVNQEDAPMSAPFSNLSRGFAAVLKITDAFLILTFSSGT
jgi:hypothetical protein